MANVKDSALPAVTSVLTTDLLAVTVDPGGTPATNKITIANFKTSIFASPTLVTPTIGVATATSINKVAITAPATSATLTIADGKTLTVSNILTFAGTDSTVMTFPTTSATIARTDSAQTFTGVQTFVAPILGTPTSVTLTNATGLPPTTGIVGWPANASGVLTNNGSGTLSWGAAGGGLTIGTTAITSGTATRLLYETSGNVVGEISGVTSDGTNITALPVAGVITQTSNSATAFQTGPNGGTNPVLRIVNSTASQADGISITGGAAGAGTTIAALSSGSNSSIILTPKGTGSVVTGPGLVGSPAIKLQSATVDGIYSNAAGSIDFTLGGLRRYIFQDAGFYVNTINGLILLSNNFEPGIARSASGIVEVNNGTLGAGGALLVRGAGAVNGQALTINSSSELLTLSTSGTTTDTTANLLPANAIILSVTVRITTTITTATDWSVGDPTTATRFSSANATLTAGTTSVGLNHMKGAVSTDAAGPTQISAAKVRITTTGTPGAGACRITCHYVLLSGPTS